MDKYTMQKCKFYKTKLYKFYQNNMCKIINNSKYKIIVDKTDDKNIKLYSEARIGMEWKSKHKYELYGIVEHNGGMGGGHYTSYV